MASLGRKLARQNKRNTPEGKEQLKQEKTEKQAALPPQNKSLLNPHQMTGHQPQMRLHQRRSGNA